MSLSVVEKNEVLVLLDELPPEALSEVRQFVEFLKFKRQNATQQPPVAIGGWLSGYDFSSEAISQARSEMWARFEPDAA
jgi:hypothetical protein